MVSKAYIGIGSNIGNSKENCIRALTTLDDFPRITITRKSSFYKTEPIGLKKQDWFTNIVVEIETSLNPELLLETLFKIERTMGRIRQEKWGPRIIDLDLLFYENLLYKFARLSLSLLCKNHLKSILLSALHPSSKTMIGDR